MNELANFHFLRPEWLWLLVPLLVVLVLGLRRSNSGDWQSQVDRELLPYLLEGDTQSPRYGVIGMLVLGGLLAIGAMAGPAWRELPQPLFRNQAGIVVALDLSRSMNATDLKPDRISRARFKISDIISAWPDGQIALLVYAADAFTVTPLTDDRSTLTLQLPALDIDLMPAQGSNPLAAVTLARQLLHQAGLVNGQIWLLTDGLPDNSDIDQLVDASGDYPVSVLGIGTPDGAPIATGNGFLTDNHGNIVLPKLDESPLKQLAARSGGRYARLKADNRDIDHLLGGARLGGALDQIAGEEQEDRRADLWQEEGPWLLLPLLMLAALAFRRGYMVVLLAVMITPPPASAVTWQQLWQTPDQQAQQAFDRGDNASAIESFKDPAWQAAARYRQGDFEGAAAALADQEDTTSTYNRGNAKAQLGDYQGALADYDRVLEQEPDNEDARFNRDLVQKALEEQQQQDPSSGESGDQQKNDGENEDSSPGDQGGEPNDDRGDDQNENDSESENQSDENGESSADPKNDPSAEQDDKSDDAQDKQSEADQAQPADEEGKQPNAESAAKAADSPPPMDDETRQATEQWLRRIPDDPGGLLRRKFQYQYQRRERSGNNQQGEGW